MPLVRKTRAGRGNKAHGSDDDESTPICRCRVLYLGSAVPHITKDGLQGIQEPLKELYPDTGLSSLKGIDSWLSVWSNGLLLENVDEKKRKITRFFPIESLHYCAAVRNVLVPASSDGSGGSGQEKLQKFLPLDSPFARLPNLNHPPLFACILRRTTGIKVLECHAFICKREMAANALVRCCFHAYADSTYARQLENGSTANGAGNGTTLTNGGGTLFKDPDRPIQRSVTPLNSIEKVTGWQALSETPRGVNDHSGAGANSTDEEFTRSSTPRNGKLSAEFCAEFPDDEEIYEGDENHKVWGGGSSSTTGVHMPPTASSELLYLEPDGTLKSVRSHNSRMSRPRQFISPPPPPPPPPQQLQSQQQQQQFSLLKSTTDDDASSTKKKSKKKLKKELKSQQQQQRYLLRPSSMLNLSTGGRPASVINGRPGSAMSTLTRARVGGHPHQQLIPVHPHQLNGLSPAMPPPMHPMQPIYGRMAPFPLPPKLLKAKSGKGKKGGQGHAQLLTPVPLLAPTPIGMGGHATAAVTPPPMYHHGGTLGVKNVSPEKHSPDMMMMVPAGAQYATIERGYHYHGANRLQLLNGHGGMLNGHSATLASTRSRSNGPSSKEEMATGGSSPFNTGIYRKKGHLNERAFSYSIRQEHRSRSYGSLANLQFAGEPGGMMRPEGSPPTTAEGIKKEREIIQMVRDLDLSGDEIERSQVPPELYPPRAKSNGFLHHRQHNGGHGPRITHR